MFNAREDLHRWNQKRYEALGEVTRVFFKPCSGLHVQQLWPQLLGPLGFSVLTSFCNMTLHDVAMVVDSFESKQTRQISPYDTCIMLFILVQGRVDFWHPPYRSISCQVCGRDVSWEILTQKQSVLSFQTGSQNVIFYV